MTNSPSNALKYSVEGIVRFRSLPIYFEKERDGLKPNTIRLFDKHNLNFRVEEPRYIEIENTDSGEKFFRKLTDVTRFNQWYIYSWRHSK